MTVTIRSKTYVVRRMDTVESLRESGLNLTADNMDKSGFVTAYYISKPKGKVIFLAYKQDDGNFTELTRL